MKIYLNSIEPGRCKGCDLDIYWAITYPNRKRAPLDRPVNYRARSKAPDGQEYVDVTSASHFDTCPKADRFRAEQPPPPPPLEQQSLF